MRGGRRATLTLVLLASLGAYAGPFHFLFFWEKSAPQTPTRNMSPEERAEIPDLMSAPAKQKCENWAWAAALETALKQQDVDLPQNFWVLKANGGEVCQDLPMDLNAIATVITGEYTLDDGRKVRLSAKAVQGAPTDMASLILAPRSGRPMILFWKNHAYVYRGLVYNEMSTSTGWHEYEVQQVELLDPFFDTPETQSATFDRKNDNVADINGMIDVKVSFHNGTDWLHPEKELEHPAEVFPD